MDNVTTVLRDALHNASARVVRGDSDTRYSRGIIVGIVAGFMDTGMTFQSALNRVMANMPYDSVDGCFPESWVASKGQL